MILPSWWGDNQQYGDLNRSLNNWNSLQCNAVLKADYYDAMLRLLTYQNYRRKMRENRRYARNGEHIRTEQEETLAVEEPRGTPGIPSRTLWVEFAMYNS